MSTQARVQQTFKYGRKHILRAVTFVVEAGFRSCVVFVGEPRVMPVGRIKATRKHKGSAKTIIISIGKLNYSEKRYAKRQLRNIGTVLPLRKP